MQSTTGLLYPRESGEATEGWTFVFWRSLDACFADMIHTDVQAVRMLAELECHGLEMDGSSQGNMARISTGTPDVGWKTWKTSACFTFWSFI